MMQIRKANERGLADHSWLQSRHTFSFADYWDPRHMGFSVLRVINDDHVAPGAGFPTHGHRDMEIISYVLAGALEHKDSMGNGSIIRPGDVQRMSAGTGVTHSEYNGSNNEAVRFLQIWIMPDRKGLVPGYEQKSFAQRLDGRLCLVASPDGRDGSLTVHQDVRLFIARLSRGQSVAHELDPTRRAWVHVARGEVAVNEQSFASGDAVGLENISRIAVSAAADAEILLFDLP